MKPTKSRRAIRAAAAATVCLALALGSAGVAMAGQGSHSHSHGDSYSHDQGQWNSARGVVTAFTSTSITLQGRHGTTTTYDTTGATYFEGSTAAVETDLAVGETVSLALTSTAPQTVTKVTICLEHVVGTVTGVSGNVITLSGRHGSTITVTVVPGTTTYTSGGAPSTFAAVVTGAVISAVGLPGTTAGSLTANSVNIFVPRLKTHARGVVTAFTSTSITLQGRHGTTTTYDTTGATYFEGSTAAVETDLAVGETVSLALTSTAPQTVTKVTICLEHVVGTVTGVSGNVITLSGRHGSTITVTVVPGTTTYTSGGAPSTFAAVVTGAVISAVGLPGTTAGSLTANSVNIFVPRLKTHARGVVTAFTSTSITLQGRHGTTTTYDTTGATYFEGSTAAVETDLAVGETVSLALTSTAPQTVTKVTICLEHVVGTVTGVSGNVITLSGRHGSTITVTVVPGTTTYTSGGAPSTFAAVVTGAVISAVGLPGTTAGSLTANSVNIGPPFGHVAGGRKSHGQLQGNLQGSGSGFGQRDGGSGHRH